MAKRRAAATQIIRTVPARPVAPVIKLNIPRVLGLAKRKKGHRRRSIVGGGFSGKVILGSGIGGAVLGFVETKWGASIPTVPVLGRTGTIAIVAYFLAKRGGSMGAICRDVALAGAVISGYQLGKTGKISGEVDGEAVSGPFSEV